MSVAREYRVMISAGELVAGEEVVVDPDQWANEIEHGILVPIERIPQSPRATRAQALPSPANSNSAKDARSMPMSLYRATMSAGPFRAGEYVQIDPDEWADEIEHGILVPHLEVDETDVEPADAADDPENPNVEHGLTEDDPVRVERTSKKVDE